MFPAGHDKRMLLSKTPFGEVRQLLHPFLGVDAQASTQL